MNYGSTRHYLISFCHFPYQVMKCPALGSGMQRGGRAVTFCRKPSTLRYRSTLSLKRTAQIQVRLESAVEQRASSMKPHQGSFSVNALLYLPACHEGTECFGCQPRIVVMISCIFPWLWFEDRKNLGPHFRLKIVILACLRLLNV